MSSEKAFRRAHPEPIPSGAADLVRLAVEFTHQFWTFDHEHIFPKPPPGGLIWTVRCGRLALSTTGAWLWFIQCGRSPSADTLEYVRLQRFGSFKTAVSVATQVLGIEPEHAAYMRNFFSEISEKNLL